MKKKPLNRKAKKTFNFQRSTFNAQPSRVRETGDVYGGKDVNSQKESMKFDLEDRLLEFSARIIKLVDALPNTRAGNHVAGQLLRCGTSPYANHGEVQAAESRKDFIHKLGVCFKELKEIKRWLRLIAHVGLLPPEKLRPLLIEADEIIRIFGASIRTAEKNSK
ncbi:MAG: four helix bundle protein [Spartobacteria bacterium]|nr:four helix bundle protein [Spartobacteria bacterium]